MTRGDHMTRGDRGTRGNHMTQADFDTLKARLVLVFLLLALGTTLLFVSATRELFSTGWRELARPLVVDYLDRLAADIGSPPDPARARALYTLIVDKFPKHATAVYAAERLRAMGPVE